jgi:ATP-dependent Lon protease
MSLFPGVTLPIDLGRAASVEAVRRAHAGSRSGGRRELVLVATQREPMVEVPRCQDLHEIAVVAELVQVVHGLPGRLTVILRGLERVRLVDVYRERGHVVATHVPAPETSGDPTLTRALAGALQDLVRRHDELLPTPQQTRQRRDGLAELGAERSPGRIADMAAAHVELDAAARASLLQELHVPERLRRTIELISHRVHVLEVKRDLDRQVRENLSQHEHEAYLRHQLRAIRAELDEPEEEDDPIAELRGRLARRTLSREAREAVEHELSRLEKQNPQSGEAAIARTWCEWVLDLPWGPGDATEDRLDIPAARRRLDLDQHGLEKVKRRIIEYLCVRKLAPTQRGALLCLVGPPGVGKTSLARSIATAMGRRFVRISLGGVRDDAEIRGHRRTYVGANPGRLITAMKQARAVNPVFLLDEVDKLGAPDLRGDPTAALLEALDPEQNAAFRDHYLDLDYDLSRVMFVCTANELGAIPHVLRDRLEVIEIGGYTLGEKLAIARGHLLPRGAADHGLADRVVTIDDEALELLATVYTRESGVRELARKLEALLRDQAMRIAEHEPTARPGSGAPIHVRADALARVLGPPRFHEALADREPRPGVVTGLGWTPVGGTLLFVEATSTPGDGRVRLTGNLGEVMRESAQTALSLVRSDPARFGLPDARPLERRDVHVHLPAGGTPKDGPSAGVAVTAALVSAFTGRAARPDVAMTGEVTLRGHVLPVGGVREKVLAAHRAGIRDVVLPLRNRKDEEELPAAARRDLRIHWVSDIGEVLDLVLLPRAAAS